MATGVIALDLASIFDRDIASDAAITRTKMAEYTNAFFPINPTDWRVWDALSTLLPSTSATDDLGLILGTFGSAATYVGTGDVKTTSVTRYARAFMKVPHDWGTQLSLTLRVYAGMITTIADGSATIDFEVWRIDRDGTLGAADICATSAQSINNLTAAAKDFTLTPTTISAGDTLDIRMTMAIVDTATVTAVKGAVWDTIFMVDLK